MDICTNSHNFSNNLIGIGRTYDTIRYTYVCACSFLQEVNYEQFVLYVCILNNVRLSVYCYPYVNLHMNEGIIPGTRFI